MSEKTKQNDNSSFQVDLDSEIRTLSGRSLRSLLGLFAHLESLGMRQAEGRYLISGGQVASAPHRTSAQGRPERADVLPQAGAPGALRRQITSAGVAHAEPGDTIAVVDQ